MDNFDCQKSNADHLSFVIPVKNDIRVVNGILYIKKFADINKLSYEIIVCGEINHEIPIDSHLKIIHIIPAKKGKCVQKGVLHSNGNIVIIFDADTPVSYADMSNLLSYIKYNEIVIGNRYIDSDTRIYKNMARHISSRFFSFLIKKIFKINYDTQCGFKIFKSSVAKNIFRDQVSKGFIFDVEIFIRAEEMNLNIIQRNIKWRQSSSSTINLIRIFIPTIMEIIYLTYWNIRRKNNT